MKNKNLSIYFRTILYVLMVSGSFVFIHNSQSKQNALISILFISITSAFFYNIINIHRFRVVHISIIKSPFLWLLTSCSIGIQWFSIYYADIIGGPVEILVMACLFEILIATFFDKNIIKIFTTLVLVLISIWVFMKYDVYSFILCFVSGLSGYIYCKSSYAISRKMNLNSRDILSIRFYPTILIIIGICAFNYYSGGLYNSSFISFKSILVFIIIAFTTFILPVLLFQSIILKIGAEKAVYILSLVPLSAMLMDGIFMREWYLSVIIICLVLIVFLNYRSIIALLNKIIIS
ncbi:hypothetical protein [Francisella sp. SYW-9]|uniref:hypothetical protein n=1 Tax=Francisella sp. SYW-9 TaxID=2610888 RepID=UPI00123CEE23|nr:hypothetical protein [Francisella sp. SYW-9]